jgi:NAD(P)-dependent dehydrogenase (short-subunit alcohol dehydrogenase family)
MHGKLQNKGAVITGGTSGRGLAEARLFIEDGASLFIMGRRQKEFEEAMNSMGSDVLVVRVDVTNLDDLDRLYETVTSKRTASTSSLL